MARKAKVKLPRAPLPRKRGGAHGGKKAAARRRLQERAAERLKER